MLSHYISFNWPNLASPKNLMFTDKTKTQEKETVEIVRGLGNINKFKAVDGNKVNHR